MVQVLVSDAEAIHVFQRDLDGKPHFFKIQPGEQFMLVGVACMGPKPDADQIMSTAQLPPPIDATALLNETLPPGTPIIPLQDEPKPKRQRGRPMKKNPKWKGPPNGLGLKTSSDTPEQ